MRRMLLLLLASIPLLVAAACASEPKKPPEPVALTLLFNGTSETFNQQYGTAFAERHPEITVNVVSLMQAGYKGTYDSLARAIETTQPDIVQSYELEYGQLADKGELVDLGPYIEQSDLDLDKLYPPVVDELRARGQGNLYGLVPYFSPYALFYNKTMFQKYGVPLPQDQMSWPEVLDLAMRFPANENVTGIYHGPYTRSSFIFYSIGPTEGLKINDPTGKKLLVDTEQWRPLWSKAIEAYRTGALKEPSPSAPFVKTMTEDEELQRLIAGNWFAAGRSAMKLDSIAMVDQIERLRENKEPGIPEFDWDIVTMPVGSANRDSLPYFDLYNIFSIMSDSAHKDAAWELIDFMNGEETAKRLGAVKGAGYFTTITDAMAERADKNMAAFSKIRKVAPEISQAPIPFPDGFLPEFYKLGDAEIDAVLHGGKTADDALRGLQQSGQAALDLAWSRKNGSAAP